LERSRPARRLPEEERRTLTGCSEGAKPPRLISRRPRPKAASGAAGGRHDSLLRHQRRRSSVGAQSSCPALCRRRRGEPSRGVLRGRSGLGTSFDRAEHGDVRASPIRRRAPVQRPRLDPPG